MINTNIFTPYQISFKLNTQTRHAVSESKAIRDGLRDVKKVLSSHNKGVLYYASFVRLNLRSVYVRDSKHVKEKKSSNFRSRTR